MHPAENRRLVGSDTSAEKIALSDRVNLLCQAIIPCPDSFPASFAVGASMKKEDKPALSQTLINSQAS